MYNLKQFVKDRNEALLSLDETKIREFAKKYEIPISDKPIVFWASIHKARMEVTSFSEKIKEESRNWLIANHFSVGITDNCLMECLHCNGFGYKIFEDNIERKVRTTDPDDLQYHHNPESKSRNKSLI